MEFFVVRFGVQARSIVETIFDEVHTVLQGYFHLIEMRNYVG